MNGFCFTKPVGEESEYNITAGFSLRARKGDVHWEPGCALILHPLTIWSGSVPLKTWSVVHRY